VRCVEVVNDERAERPLRVEMQIEIAKGRRMGASFMRNRNQRQQGEQPAERPADATARQRVRDLHRCTDQSLSTVRRCESTTGIAALALSPLSSLADAVGGIAGCAATRERWPLPGWASEQRVLHIELDLDRRIDCGKRWLRGVYFGTGRRAALDRLPAIRHLLDAPNSLNAPLAALRNP
jgi:hypothetical protein